jgi:steroid delta-isomerase
MTDALAIERSRAFLAEYVASFNEGIRTGDRGAMLARFSPDAVLEFRGVPVGPFHGRESIAAAYADMPPDDEISIIDAVVTSDHITAVYAWHRDVGVAAGRMLLDTADGLITRLVVTFEPVILPPAVEAAR